MLRYDEIILNLGDFSLLHDDADAWWYNFFSEKKKNWQSTLQVIILNLFRIDSYAAHFGGQYNTSQFSGDWKSFVFSFTELDLVWRHVQGVLHIWSVFCLLTDVDECSKGKKCHHICLNIPGSYICACRRGHYLSLDKVTCQGKVDNTWIQLLAACIRFKTSTIFWQIWMSASWRTMAAVTRFVLTLMVVTAVHADQVFFLIAMEELVTVGLTSSWPKHCEFITRHAYSSLLQILMNVRLATLAAVTLARMCSVDLSVNAQTAINLVQTTKHVKVR